MTTGEESIVISQKKLKVLMGGLATGLPTALFLGDRWFFGATEMLNSISGYYYSDMRDVFVGILFAIGVFMLTYEGYNLFERMLSNLGGVLAIMVALFPTTAVGAIRGNIGTIHIIAAGSFYFILFIFVFFQFTKSKEGEKTIRKRIRNFIYYLCGAIIFGVLVLLVLTEIDIVASPIDNSTFWLEYIGNTAFGIAFLVKGEGIFLINDDPILKMNPWEIFGLFVLTILAIGSILMLGYIVF